MSGSVYTGDYEALKKAKGQSRLLMIGLVASVLLFATLLWNTSRNAEEFSVRKVKSVRLLFVRPTIAKVELGQAIAVLKGPSVEGTVYFSQSSSQEPVFISGSLRRVSPNSDRGFHIQ